MRETPIPCLVCSRPLTNFADSINQPLAGVAFETHGHYGSTLFDPMDGSMLEVNVCDGCLRNAARMCRVLHHPAPGPPRRGKATKWSPDE